MKIYHFQECDVPPPKKGASQKTSGGGTLKCSYTQDECIPFALDSEDHPNDSDVVHVPVNLRGNKLIIIVRNFTR